MMPKGHKSELIHYVRSDTEKRLCRRPPFNYRRNGVAPPCEDDQEFRSPKKISLAPVPSLEKP